MVAADTGPSSLTAWLLRALTDPAPEGEILHADYPGLAKISDEELGTLLPVAYGVGPDALIAAIPEDAWQAIKYPQAIWNDQLGCWASDAEVAETEYAAKKKALHVTARLIVRRVRDKNKDAVPGIAPPPTCPRAGWYRVREWLNFLEAACGPPAAAA